MASLYLRVLLGVNPFDSIRWCKPKIDVPTSVLFQGAGPEFGVGDSVGKFILSSD